MIKEFRVIQELARQRYGRIKKITLENTHDTISYHTLTTIAILFIVNNSE